MKTLLVIYSTLLKQKEEFEGEGKNLPEENLTKMEEYRIILLDNVHWENKNQYFFVISNFVEEKIDTDQYIHEL